MTASEREAKIRELEARLRELDNYVNTHIRLTYSPGTNSDGEYSAFAVQVDVANEDEMRPYWNEQKKLRDELRTLQEEQ